MGAEYRAGVCNIGFRNRTLRAVMGVTFLALSLALWYWMRVASLGWYLKVLLFLPLFVGFIGLYQASIGFCAYHAFNRTYDLR